jgi:glycerol-3-phosphate dehydrogenase
MVVAVARTAAARGAHVVTRTRVEELVRVGGRVCGANVVDEESGRRLTIPARHVALAVGAWTDAVRATAGGSHATHIRPSKGIHLTVARDRIPMATGVLARTEKSVLFIIPTAAWWLIGDTDTPWAHGPDEPVANSADIDYVLAKANALLAEPLTRADVRGVFAGLRPLVGPADGTDTTRLSRRHVIETPVPGLTTIAGGKYTTYRVMAADLIDAATRDIAGVPGSSTERVPILGADGFAGVWQGQAGLAAQAGVEPGTMARLLRRYGDGVSELLALIGERPELAEPLEDGDGHLAAEIVHACTHEGALHLADVLERRTRLAITRADRGEGAAAAAAALMAEPLGWSRERTEWEIDDWRRRVAAMRAGEAQPDDERAVRAYRAALAAEPGGRSDRTMTAGPRPLEDPR